MTEILGACWHAMIVVAFVVCELWLVIKIVRVVRHRRKDDPLPPQVHEVSHETRNESTALRGVLRRWGAQPDPIRKLLDS